MLLYGVAAASKWRCVGSGDQFTYRSAAFPPYKGHVKNRGSNVLTWLKTFFLSVFGFWEAKSLAGSPQKWLPPINFTEDITLPSTAHVYEYQGLKSTLIWNSQCRGTCERSQGKIPTSFPWVLSKIAEGICWHNSEVRRTGAITGIKHFGSFQLIVPLIQRHMGHPTLVSGNICWEGLNRLRYWNLIAVKTSDFFGETSP